MMVLTRAHPEFMPAVSPILLDQDCKTLKCSIVGLENQLSET